MKGIIYQIYSTEGNECYIGCTTLTLKRRWSDHKCNYRRYLEGRHGYTSSFYLFTKYSIDNVHIRCLDEVIVDSKQQLYEIEKQYIQKTPNCINLISGIIDKEIQELHKHLIERVNAQLREMHQQYSKEYRERYKQKISGQQKDYYEQNKDKISEHKKDYYEQNKEKISEQRKDYRNRNREKISKQKKEQILCAVCNCHVTQGYIRQHERSHKHQSNLTATTKSTIT